MRFLLLVNELHHPYQHWLKSAGSAQISPETKPWNVGYFSIFGRILSQPPMGRFYGTLHG